MVTGKILEVGEHLSIPCRHMNLYFQSRQWNSECIALKGRSVRDMQSWLPYMEEGALAVRFQPAESQPIIEQFPRLPTAVRWLETADTLMHETKEWWPRLFLYDTLRKIVIGRFRDLDISMNCYVIGATHLGRAAVAAMASLGFSRISIVDEDEIKLRHEVAYLKKYVLGITLEGVPASMLTVQTHAGSLMLNTLHMPAESSLLSDLSYFNFMTQRGVVVDISECDIHNQLLQEAESADLKILTGLEVQAQIDVDLLTKLFPDQYITYDDYFESFRDQLESLKNSPSV